MPHLRRAPLLLRALSALTSATLLLTAVAAVSLCVGAWTGRTRLLHVLTGSMAPTFPVGTPLLVTPTPAARLQVGDVVSFHPPAPYAMPGGAPVLHRIVALEPTRAGRQLVVTKGDANARPDPWRLDTGHTRFHRVLLAAPWLSGAARHLPWLAAAAVLFGAGLDGAFWWSRRRRSVPGRHRAGLVTMPARTGVSVAAAGRTRAEEAVRAA